jgi:hypothetical protein
LSSSLSAMYISWLTVTKSDKFGNYSSKRPRALFEQWLTCLPMS